MKMNLDRRKPALKSGEGVKVERAITINHPVSEVYAFWRDLENLPSFMKHLDSVTVQDEQHSHWVVRRAENELAEWDAEIIEDRRDEIISWRSLPDAEIQNAGSVCFSEATGGRGTMLKVSLKYSPPGGKFGATIAKLFGANADKMIAEDLFRLKALLETGEMPTIEGQPQGNQKAKK
jgi:uncharacterized membrane protein